MKICFVGKFVDDEVEGRSGHNIMNNPYIY